MTTMSYSEQLRHPNWQRRRLEMLEAARFECTNCGSTEKTLHVHHKRYIKGRMAWEYEDAQLEVLCENCHTAQHILERELKDLLSHAPTGEALALLRGFYAMEEGAETWCGNSGYDHGPAVSAAGLIGWLCRYLRADELASVAAYAISLTPLSSDERKRAADIMELLKAVP